MKKKFFSLLSIFLILFANTYGDDGKLPKAVMKNMKAQVNIFPQEKLYIHNDKPYYVAGERIWLRAHLVEAFSHIPTAHSRYVYVELINPVEQLISRTKIKADNDGAFYGYIALPEKLSEGNYTIRAYTNYMKNQGEDYFFHKGIYIGGPLSATTETKVVFNFEKNNEITAKISVWNKSTNKRVHEDKIKVQINDGSIYNIKMDKDSVAYFPFNMSNNIRNRILWIGAGNHEQFVGVPTRSDDYEVDFFPEGGYVIEDVNNRVAFKVLQSNGLSTEMEGEIVDFENNWVCDIETVHNGMGMFEFIPEKGKKYYAICITKEGIEKRFALPETINTIPGLTTEWTNDKLFVSINQSPKNESLISTPLYLLIHARGVAFYMAEWDIKNEAAYFDKATMPPGLLQVVLLDGNMNPINERLVFCRKNSNAQLSFGTDKQEYGKRQKINANIKLTDDNGKPLRGNFSLSVTDDKDVLPDSLTNIISTLMLSSEINGYIENPSYYFSDDEFVDEYLDLVLMTHGWRRYDIYTAMKGKFENPDNYLEVGQVISGVVKKLGFSRNKPEQHALVSLISPNGSYANMVVADENGRFEFKGFDLPDSTKFIIQATNQKGNDYVELLLDTDTFPSINKFIHIPPIKQDDIFDNYITKAEQKYTLENGMRMIYLDEVVVKGKKTKRKDLPPFESIADKSYNGDRIDEMGIQYLSDLFLGIAGLHKNGKRFFFRNSKKLPLMVIDGIYLEQSASENSVIPIESSPTISKQTLITAQPETLNEGTGYQPSFDENQQKILSQAINYYTTNVVQFNDIGYDFDYDNIDIKDIENVSLIHPDRAGIAFGFERAAGGAIVITTKSGRGLASFRKPQLNIRNFIPLGYQKPAEFYSPKYETPEQVKNPTPDLRTTIYWKPNVMTSRKGEASFEFYSADTPSTYSVIIEGVTNTGQTVSRKEKIIIK